MVPDSHLLDPGTCDAPAACGLMSLNVQTRPAERGGGGVGLAHAQVGRGKDVVLIHGAMTCLDDMALALFSSLQDEFRVTAFDRPGHGRNPATTLTGTPWRQAEAIHHAAQALALNRPVVVGHSFGRAVALAYALSCVRARNSARASILDLSSD